MYLMGIDVGTSGCKAALFNVKGVLVKSAYRAYPLIFSQTGWMELDPMEVYAAVISCMKECCADGMGKDVMSVAVSSQGEAIIPVGSDGKPLYNSIVTFDTRNIREYEWFSSRFEKAEIMKITGAPIHTMFSLTKILWIKNHLPEIYSRIWKLMCFGDFISFKLGAGPAMDYSMASRTMAFDIVKKEWSDRILDPCGVSKHLLPDAVSSGTRIGTISKEISEETGLSQGAVIAAGGHDQVCCALGAGVVESGIAMDSLGTTESILCISNKTVVTPEMIEYNLPCYVYAVEGFYAYLTFLSCSGSILKWYKEGLLGDNTPYPEFDKRSGALGRPGGIFMLPHFAGSGTPYLDVKSKGIFAGLTLGADKYGLYLAIMEGTAFETLINIENMEKCGIELREFRCIGGGSNSDIWMQIKADVTGKSMTSMEVSEAGCLGAAALAGTGIGEFKNGAEAVKKWVKAKNVFEPDASMHEQYCAEYKKYRNLYEVSKSINSSY
jgi:xylulokinase